MSLDCWLSVVWWFCSLFLFLALMSGKNQVSNFFRMLSQIVKKNLIQRKPRTNRMIQRNQIPRKMSNKRNHSRKNRMIHLVKQMTKNRAKGKNNRSHKFRKMILTKNKRYNFQVSNRSRIHWNQFITFWVFSFPAMLPTLFALISYGRSLGSSPLFWFSFDRVFFHLYS